MAHIGFGFGILGFCKVPYRGMGHASQDSL